MTAAIHNFAESLAKSHAQANAPWWLDVYRQAFPSLLTWACIRKDGFAQRGGIDRILTLDSGRTISVDEKVRYKVYPDILLERWSDPITRTPGWVQKPLACDYIAYAFVPTQTCYLLPTLTLQRAWRIHGRKWVLQYKEVRAENEGYYTASVPVPIDVLMTALGEAMCIHWGEPQ